jgi:hypothetical protein
MDIAEGVGEGVENGADGGNEFEQALKLIAARGFKDVLHAYDKEA